MKRKKGQTRDSNSAERMAKFKVVVTHPEIPVAGLDLMKPKCDLIFVDQTNRDEVIESVQKADAMFVFGHEFVVDEEFLKKSGTNLKVIANMGTGVDHLDVPRIKAQGIKVSNTAGALDRCVAEVAIGLVLSVAHRLTEGLELIRKNQWVTGEPQWCLGTELYGSTVGIIGLGNIGKAVARRIYSFEPEKILYTGTQPKPYASEFGAKFVSKETLLSSSDFVFLCCPLTPETTNLINKKTLGLMKKSSILINVSRGCLINQDDLLVALQNKDIAGAGLDVTVPEPLPPDHPLLALDNCLISPHLGSATRQTRDALAVLTAKNLLAGLEGTPMITPL